MTTNDTNGKLKFKRQKYHVFTIVSSQKKEVGSVRIEPDAILWKPGGGRWHKLSIAEFGNLIMQHGTQTEGEA